MANAAENTQHGPSEGAQYPDLVIVGAGLFGLTVAQQAVEHTGARVHIIDIRDHIGGNAYSYMDEETGAELGHRLTVPMFSLREMRQKYEVHARRDEEAKTYVLGIVPREVAEK